MLSLNTVHPSSSAFSYSAPRQLHQSRRQKNAGPVGFQFTSQGMSLLRKQARRRSFPKTKTTRAGMGENALGIFLISLLDDIAFIGLTSAAASATTTTATNFALLGDLSESNPGDVEAPTGAIFALAILIGGGFLVATTFGLKPGADAQDEMRKRDEAIFNKPIQKKEKKGKK
jgi:hypothetical protein